MNALPLILFFLAVIAIAYRYYSAFLAAKVMVLDDARVTPAHRFSDGQNYVPTNKWVLFGHHFAAISGAGPLIGPVLAAQFGYLPGLLWLAFGVVFAGAAHDFVILSASVRRNGRSLAEIARSEIGPVAGATAILAILFIVVIALAGLGIAVVNALANSAWGTFTIFLTIPIALVVGLYLHKSKAPFAIRNGSIAGALAVLAAVVAGRFVPGTALGEMFMLSRTEITIAIAVYGFIASVLPVWMLLCPRDYLSSYMKLGTIAALVIGTIIVAPHIHAPAISQYAAGGGPIIPGKLFPFVFITIACGAISGFHALVGSGTTPKMIDRESDARMIGYGAMLCEGLVGCVALIAVCALDPGDYYAINVAPATFAKLGMSTVHLAEYSRLVGEELAGRTGGAVSLAIGFAKIFAGIPILRGLMSYWYHFAIMFEALFILTTIDTGTRVARFMVQEFLARFAKPFEDPSWMPGALISTALVVGGWSYFILTGSISQIWPMFGIANQLLAAVALCVGTSVIINSGRARYAWTTMAPLAFVVVTTLYAGWRSIFDNFLPLTLKPEKAFAGWLDSILTATLMVSVIVILIASARAWMRALRGEPVSLVPLPAGPDHRHLPGSGCC
ncbi:MAG: carbon starvation protein [Acidobacteriota bacterium]|jgi:carbon starvation protein|nr:carbon starvation protein [Acidobacteriota bacterium]